MARRSAPEVNAGSMADIAFLLLIFFLVATTIPSEKGINRKLPPIQKDQPEVKRNKRNVFKVLINNDGELLVEGEKMKLKKLQQSAVAFIDNGGGTGNEACSYCQGKGDPKSSDNPVKAVVVLQHDQGTDYGAYIAVQNELLAAYNQLRNRVAQQLFGENYTALVDRFKSPDLEDGSAEKQKLKKKIKTIRDMYPLSISEAKLK